MYSYFGAAMIPGYAAAKTGIVGLTQLARRRLRGGRHPRERDRARMDHHRDQPPRSRGGGVQRKVMARLPTKRWSEPEELAGTAVFLASPASRLINGVTIPVDGGYVAS